MPPKSTLWALLNLLDLLDLLARGHGWVGERVVLRVVLVDNDIDVFAGGAGMFFNMAGDAAAAQFHDETGGLLVLGDFLRGRHRRIGTIFGVEGVHRQRVEHEPCRWWHVCDIKGL